MVVALPHGSAQFRVEVFGFRFCFSTKARMVWEKNTQQAHTSKSNVRALVSQTATKCIIFHIKGRPTSNNLFPQSPASLVLAYPCPWGKLQSQDPLLCFLVRRPSACDSIMKQLWNHFGSVTPHVAFLHSELKLYRAKIPVLRLRSDNLKCSLHLQLKTLQML